jgi:hypothetical protein
MMDANVGHGKTGSAAYRVVHLEAERLQVVFVGPLLPLFVVPFLLFWLLYEQNVMNRTPKVEWLICRELCLFTIV